MTPLSSRGFTLVEVLVAASILVLVVLALSGLGLQLSRLPRTQEPRGQAITTIRAYVERLSDAIRAAKLDPATGSWVEEATDNRLRFATDTDNDGAPNDVLVELADGLLLVTVDGTLTARIAAVNQLLPDSLPLFTYYTLSGARGEDEPLTLTVPDPGQPALIERVRISLAIDPNSDRDNNPATGAAPEILSTVVDPASAEGTIVLAGPMLPLPTPTPTGPSPTPTFVVSLPSVSPTPTPGVTPSPTPTPACPWWDPFCVTVRPTPTTGPVPTSSTGPAPTPTPTPTPSPAPSPTGGPIYEPGSVYAYNSTSRDPAFCDGGNSRCYEQMIEGDAAFVMAVWGAYWQPSYIPHKFLVIMKGLPSTADPRPQQPVYTYSHVGHISADASMAGSQPLPNEVRDKLFLDPGKAYQYLEVEFTTSEWPPNGPNPNFKQIPLHIANDSVPEVIEGMELYLYPQVRSTCYNWYPVVNGTCYFNSPDDQASFWIYDNDAQCNDLIACILTEGSARDPNCYDELNACWTAADDAWQDRNL